MSKGDWYRKVDLKVYGENYEKIFGKKEFHPDGDIIRNDRLKYRPDIKDNYKQREFYKLGKEIARYKKLDGVNKEGINQRFGQDAERISRKPRDREAIKEIAHDLIRGLKEVKQCQRKRK